VSALAVDRAIRRRFAEVYKHVPGLRVLEQDPFPELANTSFLIGGGDGVACPPLALSYPTGGGMFERVIVFAENEEGHSHDIRHHVSFQNVRDGWRADEGSTGLSKECLGWKPATNYLGERVYVPDLVRVRPKAEPVSLFYDFHVVSSNCTLARILLDTTKGLFPRQGALEVTFRNGDSHTIDMLRRTEPYRSSPFDATLTPGDPGVRRYRWSMQYEVESYEDHSLQGEWKQTVTQAQCAGRTLDLMPRDE